MQAITILSIDVFCLCVDSLFSFVSEHQKCTQFIMHPSTQSLIQSFPLTHSVPLTISMHPFTDSHPGFLPLSLIPIFFGRARGQGKEKGRRAVETLPDHHQHYSLCPKTYFICFSFSKHCIDLPRFLNGIVSIRVGIKLSWAKLIKMESKGCGRGRPDEML